MRLSFTRIIFNRKPAEGWDNPSVYVRYALSVSNDGKVQPGQGEIRDLRVVGADKPCATALAGMVRGEHDFATR
jgi:hypothetical protein